MRSLIAGLLLVPASCAVAHDWPMFGRDASRNAVSPEKDPPTEWCLVPGKERNVAWRARLGSESYGSPVVSDGLIWIGTNNGPPRDLSRKGETGALICFRERDGVFLWQYLSPVPKDKPDWRWLWYPLQCTPRVEGDRLWFIDNAWQVLCLDLAPLKRGDGEPREVWKIDLVRQTGTWPMPTGMGWGIAGSIGASHQGRIYVSTGHGAASDSHRPKADVPALVCIDKETGRILGREASGITRRSRTAETSSPVVATGSDGRTLVLYGGGDGFLYAFDPVPVTAEPVAGEAVLKEVWRVDVNTPALRAAKKWGPYGILGTPLVHEGRAYVGLGEEHVTDPGNLCCVDVATGRTIWSTQEAGLLGSTPVLKDGRLFVLEQEGFARALDAATGRLIWTYDSVSASMNSPLWIDGKLYVVTPSEIVILDAMGGPTDKAKPLWKAYFRDSVSSSPVFVNGTLYIASDRWLYAIRKGSAGAPVPGDPPVKSGRSPDARFVPTPHDVVDRMLELAELRETDRVYDLGSGDGRIVIAAARRSGCRSVGIEIDLDLAEGSAEIIRREDLDKRATIVRGDMLETDFSGATVVTLYVGARLSRLLAPKLKALKPGSRVVAHDFEVPGLCCEREVTVASAEDGRDHRIFLYRCP